MARLLLFTDARGWPSAQLIQLSELLLLAAVTDQS